MEIFRGEKPVGQTEARQLDYLTRDELSKISYASGISLGGFDFGHYRLQLTVRDLVSGQSRLVQTEFEVY